MVQPPRTEENTEFNNNDNSAIKINVEHAHDSQNNSILKQYKRTCVIRTTYFCALCLLSVITMFFVVFYEGYNVKGLFSASLYVITIHPALLGLLHMIIEDRIDERNHIPLIFAIMMGFFILLVNGSWIFFLYKINMEIMHMKKL